MAYVVLARKYRPQTFSDLIGQEHVTRTLSNAITHDRVHHAYLFCGARGLGKTTTARLLAKCLVCVEGPTPNPCNVCNECVAVTEGRSVDVIEIDGASNNRVDDVRNLRDQVRYLPQTARRKIYIIDEVHMLTGSAFNALLKTLEEPPEHVTFIFATTEVHELPATILSRVSRFDFRRLASARSVEHMQMILRSEKVEIEEAGLFLIARAGGGSVRDSLTLLDKVIAFADSSGTISSEEVRVVLGVPSHLAVASLATAVLARDAAATLHEFDQVVASGQDLQQLAIAFLQHLRNLVVVKLTRTRDVLLDASESEFELLQEQAAAIDTSVLSQLFDRFSRVVDGLAHTRVPRLILEMGFLDLVHAEPLLPLGDLIQQLEQISDGAPALDGAPGRSPPQKIAAPQRAAPAQRPHGQGEQPPRARESETHAPAPRRPSPVQPQRPQQPQQQQPQQPRPTSPAPTHSSAPARAQGSNRGRDQSADLSAELWRMAQESGLPGAAPPRQDGPQRDQRPQQDSPRQDYPRQDPPRQDGPRQGAPRERSHRPDKPSPPADDPNEPPPWPPDETTAAPPRSRAAREEETWPARQQTQAPSGPPAGSPEDPTCATGACPGAPRPPSDSVIEWAEDGPFSAWEQLLERIAEREPQLHGALADMGLSSLADGEIVLVCHLDRYHRRKQIDIHMPVLEELAHVHLGAPFKIHIGEGEAELPDRPSLTLVREQRRLNLQRKVDEEARGHPSIRALLDSFEGELRAVKPLISS